MFKKNLALFLFISLLASLSFAQDSKELDAERAARPKLKGEHPLVAVMKSAPSSLKKELEGVHPRVFLTQAEIDALKIKAKTQKELWQTAISHIRALTNEPPPPPAELR